MAVSESVRNIEGSDLPNKNNVVPKVSDLYSFNTDPDPAF
jgi:hypothetical protein